MRNGPEEDGGHARRLRAGFFHDVEDLGPRERHANRADGTEPLRDGQGVYHAVRWAPGHADDARVGEVLPHASDEFSGIHAAGRVHVDENDIRWLGC